MGRVKESTYLSKRSSQVLRGVNTERQSEQSGNLNRLGVHLGNDRHGARRTGVVGERGTGCFHEGWDRW